MKEVETISGLTIYEGTSVHESKTDRRCCRCGKQIETAADDRSDGDRIVCFWCAFVDPQG